MMNPMNERMSPFAVQLKGADVSGVFRLSRSRTVVGRSKVGMPDVELNEVAAAPRHCVINWNEEHKSHLLSVIGINGVYLNEKFLSSSNEPRTLQEGDEIRIGETTLVYTRST